jgi:hypothetical protein
MITPLVRGDTLPGLPDEASSIGSSLAGEPLPQGFPPDEGHDVVEEAAAGIPRVVERQDVGVIERRGDPDLAGEPVGAEQRSELGPEDLDRHLAVMLEIVRQVDGRHPAPAELALEGVAAPEGGAEAFQLVGGGLRHSINLHRRAAFAPRHRHSRARR